MNVTLADLEALPSFALLGPGFSGHTARFLLLEGLREARGADPLLVFAPFETDVPPATFATERVTPCEVKLVHAEAPEFTVELEAFGHRENVERIREAIAAGDVYQVCLTVRALVRGATGASLFSRMCERGIPRFAAWVRLPDGDEFVSASPELFFETEGAFVHTEPMKGTASPGEGGALEASEKDRAELAMITDLLRNDLAPVCLPKTVRVAHERRVIELPYALQTVSDVVGVLDPGATPLHVLRALHPGGSVTGAPKRAALTMIRELEPEPRRAYCGTLGLWTGLRSVFSLLIRTAFRTPSAWVYGVGGGIVFDSDPAAELEELHVKLGALRCRTRSSR